MKTFAMQAVVLLLLAVLAACAPKPAPQMSLKEGSLAVAGFTQPRHTGELLAGNIPETYVPVPPEVLLSLDGLLSQTITAHHKDYLSGGHVQKCRELGLGQEKGGRVAALTGWVMTGQCLGVDYILVPQVIEWQERKGGEWGVQEPAAVLIDFFVVDVKQPGIAGRFRYDEEQHSLSENMLDAGKFFKRGAKWVTAKDLASEAMEQAMERFGL